MRKVSLYGKGLLFKRRTAFSFECKFACSAVALKHDSFAVSATYKAYAIVRATRFVAVRFSFWRMSACANRRLVGVLVYKPFHLFPLVKICIFYFLCQNS